MKRRITLYIGGSAADIGSEAPVLFNWRASDLDNPAVVRNSFSRTLTLPGSDRNDRIFSTAFRVDRTTASGYDPSARVHFSIIDEAGECQAAGYAKLDAVVREGAAVSYRVTLYGGLGGFFYSLSADADGNRRTLASLTWLGGGDAELDFTINAATVAAAWADEGADPRWSVLNFAPAYNGIPDGDFDPAHAIADPDDLACLGDLIPAGYGKKGGHVLVTLGKAVDEWAAKDLRSYLQRPVLSMTAFLQAIARQENNGGYEVDASGVLADVAGLWLTLPSIPSLGSFRQRVDATLVPGIVAPVVAATWQEWTVTPALAGDIRETAAVNARLRVAAADTTAHPTARLTRWSAEPYLPDPDPEVTELYYGGISSAIFLQAIAYDADGAVVGASPVAVVSDFDATADQIAAACRFTPQAAPTGDAAWYAPVAGMTFTADGAAAYLADRSVGITVQGRGIARIALAASAYTFQLTSAWAPARPRLSDTSSVAQATPAGPTLCARDAGGLVEAIHATAAMVQDGGAGSSINVDDWSQPLRSGARVTKAMLLSGEKSPADYLIGLAQTFGWVFTVDPATQKVTICRRDDFYLDEVVDLSDRIDTAQGITITPRAATARWYDFKTPDVGGASAKEYETVYGQPYGTQRVDTGFPFNDEPVDVLRALPFRGAVTMLDRGPYWNIITQGGQFIPSPFIDGAKMTCWKTADCESLEVDVPQPLPTASVAYYNETHNGYDAEFARKCEFRDASGKPVDGQDVLVYREGTEHYEGFRLTDDLTAMDTLNGGKACWILATGPSEGSELSVPIFQRYRYNAGTFHVADALDFGQPREVFIPDIYYNPDAPLYARRWAAYLADRYGRDTKVVRCRCDLSGLRVGTDLLRRFYWWDGSLWAMNAVENYPLTSDDLPEVELIQVQDKDAYLNGQA